LSGPAGTLGSNTPSTTFTAPAAGTYILRLVVTDSAGRAGVQDVSIVVQAAPSSSGGGGGGATDLASLATLLALALLAAGRRLLR
jgi:hypothetical protein